MIFAVDIFSDVGAGVSVGDLQRSIARNCDLLSRIFGSPNFGWIVRA
jgi:hypothetical protein